MADWTPWTPQKEGRFLAHLRRTGNVTLAVQYAGIPRSTAYHRREVDATFAASWAEAEQIYNDALEAEADRRGVQGVLKPVFYQGKKIATIREYSDTLLIVRLKARMPDTYKEIRKEEHTVTLTVQLESRLSKALSQMETTRNGHGHASTPHA